MFIAKRDFDYYVLATILFDRFIIHYEQLSLSITQF